MGQRRRDMLKMALGYCLQLAAQGSSALDARLPGASSNVGMASCASP